jgi:hypothetical protein
MTTADPVSELTELLAASRKQREQKRCPAKKGAKKP